MTLNFDNITKKKTLNFDNITKNYGIYGKKLSERELQNFSQQAMLSPKLGREIVKKTPDLGTTFKQKTEQDVKKNPFITGALQGSTYGDIEGNIERVIGDKLNIEDSKKSGAYKAGEIVGTIGQFASGYAGAGGTVASGASKLIPKALPKLGKTIATEAAKDLTIGTGLSALQGAKSDLEGKELAKYIGQNLVIDLLAGGGIVAGGKVFRSLKALKGATPKEIDEVVQTVAKQTQQPVEQVKKQVDEAVNTVCAQEKSLKQEMIDKYGYMNEGVKPDRKMVLPKKTDKDQAVSKYARTVSESKNITDEMANKIEERIVKGDFSHEIFTDKKALNNAESIIEKNGMSGAKKRWDSIVNGNKVADKTDIALGQRLLTEAANRGDVDEVQRLVSDLVVEGTRSGQKVQAFSMLKKMTPEGKLYYFEKFIQKQNDELLKRYGDRAPEITVPKDLANKLLKATTQKEIEEVEEEIIKQIGAQIPANWYDKMNAWRYMSMLANPKTHMRNIVGNALFVPFRKFRDIIGTALEGKLVPEGFEKTKAILNPLSKQDKSLKEFAKTNFEANKKALTSTGKVNVDNEILKSRRIFNTEPLEKIRKFNFEMLDKEDTWFLRPAYIGSMSQYMKANKLTPEFLKSGTTKATKALEKAQQYAAEQALKATYRDASAVASAISRFTNAPTDNKLKKAGQIAVEGLLPFKKTPINILKRGLEYSPGGLLKGIKNMTLDIKKGTISPSQAIENLSQGLTGTGVMILGGYLANLGLISGRNQDDSYKVQSFESMEGKQEYSFKIGDTTYTIDWVAPMSMPFFMGVELHNSMKNKMDAKGGFARFVNAMAGIGDPIFNLSMLQGFNQLLEGYGGNLGTALTKTATNYGGQYVPTIGGQIARTLDPVRRTTYASKESTLTKPGEQFLRKQIGKVPFASQKLEPFLDPFGREQKTENVVRRAFENFISPGYLNSDESGNVEKELDKLYNELGDTTILPSTAPSYKRHNNKTIYLTPKERTRYQKTYGQYALEKLNNLISQDAYKKLPKERKAYYISKIYREATKQATDELINNR